MKHSVINSGTRKGFLRDLPKATCLEIDLHSVTNWELDSVTHLDLDSVINLDLLASLLPPILILIYVLGGGCTQMED